MGMKLFTEDKMSIEVEVLYKFGNVSYRGYKLLIKYINIRLLMAMVTNSQFLILNQKISPSYTRG